MVSFFKLKHLRGIGKGSGKSVCIVERRGTVVDCSVPVVVVVLVGATVVFGLAEVEVRVLLTVKEVVAVTESTVGVCTTGVSVDPTKAEVPLKTDFGAEVVLVPLDVELDETLWFV